MYLSNTNTLANTLTSALGKGRYLLLRRRYGHNGNTFTFGIADYPIPLRYLYLRYLPRSVPEVWLIYSKYLVGTISITFAIILLLFYKFCTNYVCLHCPVTITGDDYVLKRVPHRRNRCACASCVGIPTVPFDRRTFSTATLSIP